MDFKCGQSRIFGQQACDHRLHRFGLDFHHVAIALHVANNVLVFGLGTFGLAEVNMTEGSPIGLAIQTGGLVVFAAIIARASRRVDRYTVSASASKMV